MRSYALILLAAVFMGFSEATDYCASSLCAAGRTHVACGHNGKFASTCPADAKMVTVGAALKKVIVNAHNKKRNLIAGGNVANHKAACRMATMQWDPQLAEVASYNVRQCAMAHDKCRNTPTYLYSGQNLAWRGFNGELNKSKLFQQAINNWYGEVKDSKMSYIMSYPSNYKGPAIGHFTVMVAERNIRVGCAAATYSTKGVSYKTFLVACNYATTNMFNNPIYTNCTKSASQCKKGKNGNFPNLCAIAEPYSINKW